MDRTVKRDARCGAKMPSLSLEKPRSSWSREGEPMRKWARTNVPGMSHIPCPAGSRGFGACNLQFQRTLNPRAYMLWRMA